MPHFKLTIAYDGAGFVGWQRQATGPSIQGLIEDALGALDGRAVVVSGAGRTDAGVHALGQVATVSIERIVDPAALVRAVNARLPDAVRVLDAVVVTHDFHARFSASVKTYRYRIWNARTVSPFERDRVWHVPSPALDADAMAAAAAWFVGRHDFAAFQATGGAVRSPVRTIRTARVVSEPVREGALITFEVAGDGFLRHMVRIMAGTLVEVGRGRRSAAWVADVLRSGLRSEAGPTAPPDGLLLVSIDYV